MCMEDVRIGRDTSTIVNTFTTSAASTELLKPNPLRLAIILSPPAAGTVFYSPEPISAGGNGLCLQLGSTPLALNVKDHGDIVRQGWYGRGDAANRVHTVIETILARQ